MTPPPRASRVPSGDQLRPSSRLSRLLSGRTIVCTTVPPRVIRRTSRPNTAAMRSPVGDHATSPLLSEPRLIVQSRRPPAEKTERSPRRGERPAGPRSETSPCCPEIVSRTGAPSVSRRPAPRGLRVDRRCAVRCRRHSARTRCGLRRATSSVSDPARSCAARSPLESRPRPRGRGGSARCTAFPTRLRACCRPAPNPCRRSCQGRRA